MEATKRGLCMGSIFFSLLSIGTYTETAMECNSLVDEVQARLGNDSHCMFDRPFKPRSS
jgi:hypothetical protein